MPKFYQHKETGQILKTIPIMEMMSYEECEELNEILKNVDISYREKYILERCDKVEKTQEGVYNICFEDSYFQVANREGEYKITM